MWYFGKTIFHMVRMRSAHKNAGSFAPELEEICIECGSAVSFFVEAECCFLAVVTI